MWRRWDFCRRQAIRHAALAEGSGDTGRVCLDTVAGLVGRAARGLARGEAGKLRARLTNDASMAGEAGRQARMAAYHARLRVEYESAARHPWLPFAPDPSEPE